MKPKLGKKKKGKVDVGDAFAALGLEDGGKAEGNFSATNGNKVCESANGHLAGTDPSRAQQAEVEVKTFPSSVNGGLSAFWPSLAGFMSTLSRHL